MALISDLPRITVLGAGGWIGSSLVSYLKSQNRLLYAIDRSSLSSWLAGHDKQTHVIYAIGLTSDFRLYPHATVDAHVSLLSRVLQRQGLENLLFLSSTRVYGRSSCTSETAELPCLSSDPSDLYNLSKLLGESLVLQDPRPGLKVARLSNVLGLDQPRSTFLGSLLHDARLAGSVRILQHPDHAKDYVHMSDVIRLLPQIACAGRHRLYNLGRGENVTHYEIAQKLRAHGAVVHFSAEPSGSPSFPQLQIGRLKEEFDPPGDPFRQNLLQHCLNNGPQL